MYKSKIHGATLTGLELEYQGSISVDLDLLELADILPGEQVHVLNFNNASRVVTYTIAAERGSGTIMLNGPAARLGSVGDRVVILSYCQLKDDELVDFKPKLVLLDEHNQPVE